MPKISAAISAGLSLTRRAYAGGHFVFALDGAPIPGYVRSVEGGTVTGEVIDEIAGPDFTHFKHLGTVAIEPITVQLGMSMSRPIFDWISASWKRDFSRRNGALIHTDASYRSQFEQWFTDALITETTFPTLDGSSTEPSYLTVKLQPERVQLKPGDLKPTTSTISPLQKQWSASSFRFFLDGLDTSHVNKIDSFSVTQQIKELYVGSSRFPEIEPTGVEFGNLSVYTSLAHADHFLSWYKAAVVQGDKDTRQERQGAIEFMAPGRGVPLFVVSLQNVGIFGFTIEKSEAGSDQAKRCKIDLYVESMSLHYAAGMQ